MVTCSRCRNIVDETKQTTCPVCAAPLPTGSPAAAQAVRTSLSGEVIEVAAAPQPPSGVPLNPYPAPIPPTSRPTAKADYSTAPVMQQDEKRVITAGLAIGGVLALLLLVGVGALYLRYSRQQAAFEKSAHIHLDTPAAAAEEMVNAARDQNWGRLYWICEFADNGEKKVAEAAQVGAGFRRGFETAAQNSPEAAQLSLTAMQSIRDVKITVPPTKGDHVQVNVTSTMTVGGQTRTLNGVLPMVNAEDGKWRVDLTSVSLKHPGPEDAATFIRVYYGMFGLGGAGGSNAAALPRSQPSYAPAGYPRSTSGFTRQPAYNAPQPTASPQGAYGYGANPNTSPPPTYPNGTGSGDPNASNVPIGGQAGQSGQGGMPANTPPSASSPAAPDNTPPPPANPPADNAPPPPGNGTGGN